MLNRGGQRATVTVTTSEVTIRHDPFTGHPANEQTGTLRSYVAAKREMLRITLVLAIGAAIDLVEARSGRSLWGQPRE